MQQSSTLLSRGNIFDNTLTRHIGVIKTVNICMVSFKLSSNMTFKFQTRMPLWNSGYNRYRDMDMNYRKIITDAGSTVVAEYISLITVSGITLSCSVYHTFVAMITTS